MNRSILSVLFVLTLLATPLVATSLADTPAEGGTPASCADCPCCKDGQCATAGAEKGCCNPAEGQACCQHEAGEGCCQHAAGEGGCCAHHGEGAHNCCAHHGEGHAHHGEGHAHHGEGHAHGTCPHAKPAPAAPAESGR